METIPVRHANNELCWYESVAGVTDPMYKVCPGNEGLIIETQSTLLVVSLKVDQDSSHWRETLILEHTVQLPHGPESLAS